MAKPKQTVNVDGGRFEISRSGSFNAPYKFEGFLRVLVLGAGIGFIALVSLVSIKVLRNTVSSSPEAGSAAPFYAMTAALVIFIAVVLAVLICGLTLKYISTGFKCSFVSNSSKMVLDYGKTQYTIFFEGVDMVNFNPRSLFGKINGYDVTIRYLNEIFEFSITSDSYITEKSTPFFIIQEQADRLRHPAVDPTDENRTGREIALGIGSGRAISQEEIERAKSRKNSVYDRLNDILSDDTPLIEETESDDQTYGYVSPFEGKVSPTAEGFAGDMPKTSLKFGDRRREIVYEGGTREQDLYDILKSGVFYVAPKGGGALASILLWFVLGAIAGGFIGYIVEFYTHLAYSLLVCVCLVGVVFAINGRIHTHGREYKYRADGRSMKLTSRGIPDEEIIYSEVKGITYTPKNLFGKPYALDVCITTKFRTLNYRYMYPRYKRVLPNSQLPFAIIKEHLPESK